jgi:SNF2 family DNA or RNA helicase
MARPSYSKQFFRSNNASNSKAKHGHSKNKHSSLCDAAFSLLQWAQHGQPLEELIDNYSPTNNHNSSGSHSDEEGESEEEETMVNDDENDNNKATPCDEEEETMPEWAQEVVSETHNDKEMDPPPGFKVALRSYQKQALHWMTHREQKTDGNENANWRSQLQLLKELADLGNTSGASEGVATESGKAISCDCGPVCVDLNRTKAPSVASVPDAFLVNLGSDESAPLQSTSTMNNVDEVTHPLWEKRYLCNASQTQAVSFFVQPIFQKATASPPRAPKPCRGGILADSMGLGKTVMLLALVQSSKQQDKEDQMDCEGDYSGNTNTLIVTPLSLLFQWQQEIESKTNLSYHVHYGDSKRQSLGSALDVVDIVLTTYGSLQAELQQQRQIANRGGSIQTNKSLLLSRKWKRVILDECHAMKNPGTCAAKACYAINAERRWCVSGTIIQNSLEDVYSLMRFLRHEPWCEQGFWKAAITKASDMHIALDRVKRVLGSIM